MRPTGSRSKTRAARYWTARLDKTACRLRPACGGVCARCCGRLTQARCRPAQDRSRSGALRIAQIATRPVPGRASHRCCCACPRSPWRESAAARLRAGEASKVVLAREVIVRGDGVMPAGMVARSLRSAYPSCFTYLITGADGTAFAGASPELLIRRIGSHAHAEPMAGSVARGSTAAEDERLAEQLRSSRKDAAEHDLVSRFVVDALRPFSRSVAARPPEVVRPR